MDLDRIHLNLRVVDWVQTISVKGLIDPAGPALRARCSAMDDLRFALSGGESITQIPIDVGLSQGPLTAGNGRPLEGGVGLFNYIRQEGPRVNYVRSGGPRPPSAIACYIGLEPDFYNEVWVQVRSGAFSESSISIDLGPVQPPGQLLVLGASFNFTYSRRQPPRPL